jgi:hypothetical protein
MDDPVCDTESYIYYKEDIISLKPGRENAWMDSVVEKCLRKISHRFTRVCSSISHEKMQILCADSILAVFLLHFSKLQDHI